MSQHADKQCRICLEGEGDLIAPCLCSGTSKWIHRRCLDNWRTSQYNYRCFTHCTTCSFQYRVKYLNGNRCLSRKAKVRLFVARDLITVLLVLQIVIAALGAVVFAIDQATGHNILKEIPHSGEGAAVGVYYLCGLLALLASLGLFTLLGVCCCSSDACRCDDDSDADLLCCAYCYCCWWGYPCYPMWYCSPLYYPHGAACCGAPGMGHCFQTGTCCVGGDCHGDNCSGGDARVMIILLLVVLAILALIGLFVMIYVLAIVGQRLFQRHVEILARQEACRQQEIVDLSKINMSQVGNYAVVSLEPSAPPEPEQVAPNQVAPSAPPKDTMEVSEPLWVASGRENERLLDL